MQQDTLFGEMERPLTQNLYVYCLNNGVNLRDPSGNYSVPLSIEMAGPKAVEDYLIGTGQKKKSKTDTLNDQKKKAESMGVTGSTLAGIQAEIDKIESNSNKPNGGGTGSGNSGSGNNGNNLTPSGGGNSSAGNSGSSSGGSNYPTGTGNPNTGGNDKPELTEWEKRLYELYKNGQLGLMEREYFQKNIAPRIFEYNVNKLFRLNDQTITIYNDGKYAGEIQANLKKEEYEALYRMSSLASIDPTLVLAIIAHESRFKNNLVSNAGASGYTQLLPDTFNQFIDYNLGVYNIALDYAEEGINDVFNSYANMAAEINLLTYWRDLYGVEEMLPPLRQGYRNYNNYPSSGWSDNALNNKKEFLDIKSQYDDLLWEGGK